MKVHFLCLRSCCRFPRTNCPDRLVGDDDTGHLLSGKMKKCIFQLSLDKCILYFLLPDVECFPTTENGCDAMPEAEVNLLCQDIARLTKIFAPLAMPDDAIFNTNGLEHFNRYF